MGYIVNKSVAIGRAYLHSVNRTEAAYIMGVRAIDIADVPAVGVPFANQSNRWAVYIKPEGLQHTHKSARIFTDPKEAREYFDTLQ